MADTQHPGEIRKQVWRAVDPTGETRSLINAAIHGHHVPDWLARMGVEVDTQWGEVVSLSSDYRRLVDEISAAVRVLGPRGWAVMAMQTETIAKAVQLVEAGRAEQADDLLAEQWDGEGGWRTERVCVRVGVMGVGDPELDRLLKERKRLLNLAREHHEAGHYEASIPLVQAQMEGIVMDVTGGEKFFTKKTRDKADLVDPARLVSIEAGLAALQVTFGTNVDDTQTKGSLSRHGVMHGRELAYDTRVNSAKTWSVLDALVEWAGPRGRDEVARRKAERQSAAAGSQEVDRTGRRVDDREFSETRAMLRVLSNSAIGWHRQRGRFREDLVGGVYSTKDFTKRGLPAEHGTSQQARADGQEVMYWRETVSGWFLGIALTNGHLGLEERYFAGPLPPAALPSMDPSGWSGALGTLPDWT